MIKNQENSGIESKKARTFFVETFSLLHTNKPKFNYRLKSFPFSIAEKKLLKAWLEFHRNHKEKSLSLLKGNPLSDPFHEGVRLYLIGLVYNQHGHFRYAVENLEKSVSLFYSLDHPFILNPVCLLVIVYANRKDTKKLQDWMDELRKIEPIHSLSKLQVFYCEIVYSFYSHDSNRALQLLAKVENASYPEYKSFAPHLLMIHLMILIEERNYKASFEVLEKYKKISENAVVKANYSFIKTLLDHLAHQKPIYIYAPRFKDFPELHQQLEVIKHLSSGNIPMAERYWNQLQLHNPALYGDGFSFNGEQSIFSQALELYQSYVETVDWNLSEIRSLSSKIDRLDYVLTRAKAPVSQDMLIQLIWNEPSDQKNLSRLRKLVSLYKKERKMKVVCAQNAYQIKR